ncbi:MAG: flagellar hook capping FlgD N-terminal domain-containing protein, partial [Sphingomonadales bacterium]
MEIVNSVNTGQASESRASSAGASLAQDFDTFLTLLTTQLQHQDPLEPMDSKEFTQQLVSFSGVEQQIQANKNLEDVIGKLASQDMAAAVSYIGQDIIAMSDKASLRDGAAQWVYALEGGADDVDLTIKDGNGVTVRTLNGETDAGTHSLNWDGRDENGNQMPDG